MQLASSHKTTLAVIGGGRWAQVMLSVLANLNLPLEHIVVSNANHQTIKHQLESLTNMSGTFSIVHTMSDLLSNYDVNAAIVVNSAHQHFETAKTLIKRGIHVLIEKPVTLSSHEMRSLISESYAHNTVIVPGLSYRFCSYIQNFAELISRDSQPCRFVLEWFDSRNEIRYQQIKRHDASIDVLQDVTAHIWTILSTVFSQNDILFESCDTTSTHNHANINVSIGNIKGHIIAQRNAPQRKRLLSVELINGENISIDFTAEPGVICHHSKICSGDPGWVSKLSPLTQQINYFLTMVKNKTSSGSDIEACLNSVSCTELASNLLQQQLMNLADQATISSGT